MTETLAEEPETVPSDDRMTFTPTRAEGLARLGAFLPRAGRAYQANRNADLGPGDRAATSLLSPWMSHGLIGVEEAVRAVRGAHDANDSFKLVSELFWRAYFQGHLEWKPDVWHAYLDERDGAFAEMQGNAGLQTAWEAATEGRTGIDAFDAWAKELVETGFLHNHTRMWFSSIWIFTLKLPWTLGADFFLRNLIDGDAASNTLNWRWTAGLHTRGKTYLATKSNIKRYTDGRFAPEDLSKTAEPLEDPKQLHAVKALDLPEDALPDGKFALLIHENDLIPETLPLEGRKPDLVIGLARPDARSPRPVSPLVKDFTAAAVGDALTRGAGAFDCQTEDWTPDRRLADIMAAHGLDTLVVSYLGQGWVRDATRDELNDFAADHDCVRIVRALDRATWPHAKAGYYGVKKKIDNVLKILEID
ncbi:MAG: FAD-binding domain-containing protein [Pacificimonas sp.]